MSSTVRVAVEGCVSDLLHRNRGVLLRLEQGHGTLHSIYASVEESCRVKGWDSVDLLIIGGDFQASRDALRNARSSLTTIRLYETNMTSMLLLCQRSTSRWVISTSITVGTGLRLT